MTMTCKFPLLDLCGKAPIRSLKPFVLVLKGMMVTHNSCVFTVSTSRFFFVFLNLQPGFDLLCLLKVLEISIQVSLSCCNTGG